MLGRGRRTLYGKYTSGCEYVMRFERVQDDFDQVVERVGVGHKGGCWP